jgi:hypothetical protein
MNTMQLNVVYPINDIFNFVIKDFFGPRIQKLMKRKEQKLPLKLSGLLPSLFHDCIFGKDVEELTGEHLKKVFGPFTQKIFKGGSKALLTKVITSKKKNNVTSLEIYYEVYNQCNRLRWPIK